jgi:hypothetical protein
MKAPDIRVNSLIIDTGIIVNFIVFKDIDNHKLPQSFVEYQRSLLADILPELSKKTIKQD